MIFSFQIFFKNYNESQTARHSEWESLERGVMVLTHFALTVIIDILHFKCTPSRLFTISTKRKNFVMIFFHFLSYFAAGNFCVQTTDISPVEFSAANVTCVAIDSTGVKVPEKINFMRRKFGKFGNYHELTANENLYFTNRTDSYGRRMTIR